MGQTAQRIFFSVRITVALRVNNRVNETLRVTIQLKIMSEVTNFIIQILAFLAHGGSSIAKLLN
jgi:hypothetical protein